jgi:hypothetical protein
MELLLRRFALAVGILCGVIGTQGPEFAQQYRQRLAGAVDELSRVVAAFDAEARDKQLMPEEAIARLETNGDPLARERGADMTYDKSRLLRLEAALAAYTDRAPVGRLIGVVENFDATTAGRAWSDFQPAIPTTLEALIVGIFALVLAWGATHIVIWPARRHFARRRALARV